MKRATYDLYYYNRFTNFFYVPCKKCDEDSRGNSMSFLPSQIDGSLVEIHIEFHDFSMSYGIQVLFVFHAGTWHGFCASSSHGIYRAFAKKVTGVYATGNYATEVSPSILRHPGITPHFFTPPGWYATHHKRHMVISPHKH